MVSQSLDSSIQVHLHKRKTSTDESRYKQPSRLSQNMGIVAPFLDQSLDFASGIGQMTGVSQASKMLKDKTSITNMPGSAQDLNRPKTSTGIRGNGSYPKMTED